MRDHILERTAAPLPRTLSELALPVVVLAVFAVAVAAVLMGILRGLAAQTMVLILVACLGGALVACVVRLFGGSLGAPEDQALVRHPGWLRYTSGRSGWVGLLCMAAFVLSALFRGGDIIGLPALFCLVLGLAAAPLIFRIQRRRAARSLPLSIR